MSQQQKQPTVEEIYSEFVSGSNKLNNVMELFYKQLKANFQEIQQKDLIIGNLQKKLEEIQPNTKKPKIQELPVEARRLDPKNAQEPKSNNKK